MNPKQTKNYPTISARLLVLSCLLLLGFTWSCLVQKEGRGSNSDLQSREAKTQKQDSFLHFPNSLFEGGNAAAGLNYMVEGKAFSSGIPAEFNSIINWLKRNKILSTASFNNFSINDFVKVNNDDGVLTATPGCFHCHAQQFNGELVLGLGNSYSSFQKNLENYISILEIATRIRYGKKSKEWQSLEQGLNSFKILGKNIQTKVQGPTPAQKIADLMAAHRDPLSLILRTDTSYFQVPKIVVPEDVPPLWNVKKRKAFSVNAMRQGNLLQHIVSSSILTIKDSAEARKIYDNAKDVWAYLKTLEAPKYPLAINPELAEKGRQVFLKACSSCHGTYGSNETYPNLVIPGDIIQTDSLMWKYYITYPEYAAWFNKSWFAIAAESAITSPQPGYVPPPLDGIWVTAPYLHNGSVPTLESLLDSKSRPRYWKRSFTEEKYNYEKIGWQYQKLSSAGGKKTYNTDLPGYGNYGHYFGDHLSINQRKALIEYLKTL